MPTLIDVNQAKFVKAFAAFLKKSGKLKLPKWVDCVVTGRNRELAPMSEDWFYIRSAAIVRRLYYRSPVGVKKLTKIFGGRKRNGVAPPHFCRGSASVARKCLQSLEDVKLIGKFRQKGRVLTPAGRKDVDRIAGRLRKVRMFVN